MHSYVFQDGHFKGQGFAAAQTVSAATVATSEVSGDATEEVLQLARMVPEDTSASWHVHRFPSRLTCFEQATFRNLPRSSAAATEAARRLASGVVEFTGLSNDNWSTSNDEDRLDAVVFGHFFFIRAARFF